ncbi:hypothetical protein [Nostoc favosum]|uniref:Uncharacterized protein n=1 Tax=Nostoc favosum CHAB5714 TaxID=2780399 RepID=A0ABS8IIP2_9NOSO|nr:hypothetical protein [Nostoc favosum]MCC5604145.1 hypothetical protein [Nostoc favosum CHAB5714]
MVSGTILSNPKQSVNCSSYFYITPKKATDKEEPNKQRALERLGTVAETLEKTSKGVEAGQKIWTTAKPILVKVATWLGAAAGSHLLGL